MRVQKRSYGILNFTIFFKIKIDMINGNQNIMISDFESELERL